MATKYKEYYYTTKKMVDGYIWRIRNKGGEILEASEESFITKREAELDAQEHIDEYWSA